MNWIEFLCQKIYVSQKVLRGKQWRRFSPLITHSCLGECIPEFLQSLFGENIIVSRVFDWFYRRAWWSGKCRSREAAGMSMRAAEIIQFAEMLRGRPLTAPLTDFCEASFVEWFQAKREWILGFWSLSSLRKFSLATEQIESQGARKIFSENNSWFLICNVKTTLKCACAPFPPWTRQLFLPFVSRLFLVEI